ncbi:uncharacterized protein MYCFIDRAFT_121798, partial [Pseudocercospora fijiensis CIRAD86]
EGSTYDGRVLNNARSYYRFTAPEGRYYLVDTSYLNNALYLVLYRSIRHYLREQYLFNLRYTSLRNVVERTFRVIK